MVHQARQARIDQARSELRQALAGMALAEVALHGARSGIKGPEPTGADTGQEPASEVPAGGMTEAGELAGAGP